jgi:hypothetical protein
MRKLLPGIILCLLATGVGLAEAETLDSKYRLETGQTFRYQLTVTTEAVQEIAGVTSRRLEEWRVEYGLIVLGGSNPTEGALIRATFESLVYKIDSIFQQYECQINPGDPALPVGIKPYAQLLGSDFMVKISNRSKPEIPDHNRDLAKPDLEKLITELMSGVVNTKYSLNYLVYNIFLPYPGKAKPLKPGDCWVGKSLFNNGQIIPELKAEYRISEINDQSFALEVLPRSGCVFKQKLSVKDNRNVIAAAVINLAGTLTGQFEVVKATMLPRTGNIAIALSGTVQKMGNVIPTTLRITVNYRMIAE